jgi:hypothetical protein
MPLAAMLHQIRVGGEGRGHHGRARQPPGNVPARNEEIVDAPGRALPVVKADSQVQGEIGQDHQAVDQGELHAPNVLQRRTSVNHESPRDDLRIDANMIAIAIRRKKI